MSASQASRGPDIPVGQNPLGQKGFIMGTLLVLFSLVMAWRFLRGSPGLPLDDAFIHLTFARNLASGHGFSFNPDEFSLGFSSPLWIMLIAFLIRLGADPVAAAKALNVGAFIGSILLMFSLLRSRDEGVGKSGPAAGTRFAVLAALVTALSGNLLWLAGAGMESTLFLALGLAAILWLAPPSPRPLLGGLALGLLMLTRGEGAVLWLLLAAGGLLSAPSRKKIVLALALSLIIAAPWFLFTLSRTGHLLPPTHAGKLASDLFNSGLAFKGIRVFLLQHLRYFYSFNFSFLLLAGFALMMEIITRWRERGKSRSPIRRFADSPILLLILWALANFALYALCFRSTASLTPYHNLRYQVMLIPAIIAGAALAAGRLADQADRLRDSANRQTFRPRTITAVLTELAILVLVVGLVVEAKPWREFYRNNVAQLRTEHVAAALWAKQNLPPDARIAGFDIGVLGFYTDRYVIDLGGLIDPESHAFLKNHRMGPYLMKKRATHYFAMVRPDSERLSGVKADDGRLYTLHLLRRFDSPPYPEPVFLHSLGIEIYEVIPLAPGLFQPLEKK